MIQIWNKNTKIYLTGTIALVVMTLSFQNCGNIHLTVAGKQILPSTLGSGLSKNSKQVIFENYDGTYYSYDLVANTLVSFGYGSICINGASGGTGYYCYSSSLGADVDGDGVEDWARYSVCPIDGSGNFKIDIMSGTKILKTSSIPCSMKDSNNNIYLFVPQIMVMPPLSSAKASFLVTYQNNGNGAFNYVYNVDSQGNITTGISQPPSTKANFLNSIFAEADGTLDYLNLFNSGNYTYSIEQNYFQSSQTISKQLTGSYVGGYRTLQFNSWLHTVSGKPNLLFTSYTNIVSQKKITYNVYDRTLSQPLPSGFASYDSAPVEGGFAASLPFVADIDGDGSDDVVFLVEEYFSGGTYLYEDAGSIDVYSPASNFAQKTFSSKALFSAISAIPAVQTVNYISNILGFVYTNDESNAKVLLSIFTKGGSENSMALVDVKNQKGIQGIETPGMAFVSTIPLRLAQ